MNTSKRFIIITSIFLFCAYQTQKEEKIQLFYAGKMHREEVKDKNTEEWYGLYELPGGFSLVKSKISITKLTETDALYDAEVKVDQNSLPRFLVKGSEKFSNGYVKAVYSGQLSLEPGQRLNIIWNGISYNIVAKGKSDGELITNYEIGIYKDQEYQRILLRPQASLDGIPLVSWIGDIDRDDKPDLLLDLRDHYNVSEETLFLSSYSTKKEIVHRVAFHHRVGC